MHYLVTIRLFKNWRNAEEDTDEWNTDESLALREEARDSDLGDMSKSLSDL